MGQMTKRQARNWLIVCNTLEQIEPGWRISENPEEQAIDMACRTIRDLAQGAKHFDELHAAHSKVAKELEEAVDILECMRDDPECSHRAMIGTFLAKLRE